MYNDTVCNRGRRMPEKVGSRFRSVTQKRNRGWSQERSVIAN